MRLRQIIESKSNDSLLIFIDIWNTLAEIDPNMEDTTPQDIEIDDDSGEPVYVDIINVGSRRGYLTKFNVLSAMKYAKIAEDIIIYIANEYSQQLYTNWEWDRGEASFFVSKRESEDMGSPLEGYESQEEELEEYGDDNTYPEEHEFLSDLFESQIPKLRYESAVQQLSNLDDETIHQVIQTYGDRPFIKRVLEIVAPQFQTRHDKYGATFSSEPPPWLAHSNSRLDKVAGELGGEFVKITLYDAEKRYPAQLYQLLRKPEHVVTGRTIAWASGLISKEKSVLSIIEIQSDVMRTAPQLLIKYEDVLAKAAARLRKRFPQLSELSDEQVLNAEDQIVAGSKSYTEKYDYKDLLPQKTEKMLADYHAIRDQFLEGFADWQDKMLEIIVEYAIKYDIHTVKLPTASRLGRFWRSVGESPNMKVLKQLYDRKLRDYATKERNWWVLNI